MQLSKLRDYPKAPLPTTLIFSYFSIAAPKRFRRLQATPALRQTAKDKKAKDKLLVHHEWISNTWKLLENKIKTRVSNQYLSFSQCNFVENIKTSIQHNYMPFKYGTLVTWFYHVCFINGCHWCTIHTVQVLQFWKNKASLFASNLRIFGFKIKRWTWYMFQLFKSKDNKAKYLVPLVPCLQITPSNP